MSIRAHRVKKIEYGDILFKSGCSKLQKFLEDSGNFNDQTNHDGGGMIEFQFSDLKLALEEFEAGTLELDEDEVKTLKREIEVLTKENYTDDCFVQYDLF